MQIKGNERADSLSSITTEEDGREVNWAYVFGGAKDVGRIQYWGCELDSVSLVQLPELGVMQNVVSN